MVTSDACLSTFAHPHLGTRNRRGGLADRLGGLQRRRESLRAPLALLQRRNAAVRNAPGAAANPRVCGADARGDAAVPPRGPSRSLASGGETPWSQAFCLGSSSFSTTNLVPTWSIAQDRQGGVKRAQVTIQQPTCLRTGSGVGRSFRACHQDLAERRGCFFNNLLAGPEGPAYAPIRRPCRSSAGCGTCETA